MTSLIVETKIADEQRQSFLQHAHVIGDFKDRGATAAAAAVLAKMKRH